MRKTLYRTRRRLIKSRETRLLKRLMKRNSLFLSKYVEGCRIALEETYQTLNDPLVSVVVPTYNLSTVLIERAIPSIINQTYPNWELVIYGDACTDDTAERMAAIRDDRIKFHNLKNRYKLAASDRYNYLFASGWKPYMCAVTEASGWWIALFNDDDEFTPDHIEALLRHAQETNAELVYGKQINALADGTRHEIGRAGFPNGQTPFFKKCVPQRTVLMRSYLKPFLFARIDFISKWGLFSGDMFWWEQMGFAGIRAEYLDKVVAIKHRGTVRAPAHPDQGPAHIPGSPSAKGATH